MARTPSNTADGKTRRAFLRGSLAAAALSLVPKAAHANAADALALGVVPDAARDQGPAISSALRAATDQGRALWLPAGRYAASNIELPSGAELAGQRGRSSLVGLGAAPILSGRGADGATLTGLDFDARGADSGNAGGHVILEGCADLRVRDCRFAAGAEPLLRLRSCTGLIEASLFEQGLSSALFANDSSGLRIAGNHVRDMADNGILVWQSSKGEDGTIITGNRIERIGNRSGGDGQWGNGINVFRAGNVIVANNRISDCTLSAIRGNAASNFQVIGNNATRIGETAIFVEFGFSGAVVADNLVDRAATGVSITNYNDGGRMATVTGNVIRDLVRDASRTQSPWAPGIGIAAEADTIVANNVLDNIPWAGLWLGYGPYLRDVVATDNVVRQATFGVAVSVVEGAERTVVRDNLISGTTDGAIVGFDHDNPVTGDLSKTGAQEFRHLTLDGNMIG